MAKELINYPLLSDANLLNYYRFEGNANDSKGTLNGTSNGITFSSGNGKFNQGMQSAAGAANGINLGNNSSLNFTSGDFSFNFWIYPISQSGFRTIFCRGAYAVDGYNMQTYTTGSGVIVIFTSSQSGAAQTIVPTTIFNLNEWQMCTMTRSGSVVKIYRNGVENNYSDQPAIINPTTCTRNAYISAYDGDGTNCDFKIDDFAIFNRELSGTEILNYYNAVSSSNFFAFF